jgi:hypothetical protein
VQALMENVDLTEQERKHALTAATAALKDDALKRRRTAAAAAVAEQSVLQPRSTWLTAHAAAAAKALAAAVADEVAQRSERAVIDSLYPLLTPVDAQLRQIFLFYSCQVDDDGSVLQTRVAGADVGSASALVTFSCVLFRLHP